LNAILGYARMLRSGILPPDKREKAIEMIERNATSLGQIVEDVLLGLLARRRPVASDSGATGRSPSAALLAS
jgi:signal transduction histidine kinase